MTTTTASQPSTRRDRREQPTVPQVPYQGLFREPVYADGRPYDSQDEPESSADG